MKIDRITLEALMKADGNEHMMWGGRSMLVSEVVASLLRGEGGVEVSPAAPAPGQPGHQAGSNLRISQAAVDALSQSQYDELKATGHIQGLTNSDQGRAVVHVSRGGSHSVNLSFDPETGKVGPGRPMDLRDFDDPAAG